MTLAFKHGVATLDGGSRPVQKYKRTLRPARRVVAEFIYHCHGERNHPRTNASAVLTGRCDVVSDWAACSAITTATPHRSSGTPVGRNGWSAGEVCSGSPIAEPVPRRLVSASFENASRIRPCRSVRVFGQDGRAQPSRAWQRVCAFLTRRARQYRVNWSPRISWRPPFSASNSRRTSSSEMPADQPYAAATVSLQLHTMGAQRLPLVHH